MSGGGGVGAGWWGVCAYRCRVCRLAISLFISSPLSFFLKVLPTLPPT